MNSYIKEQAALIYKLMAESLKRKAEIEQLKEIVEGDYEVSKKACNEESVAPFGTINESYTICRVAKNSAFVALNDDFSQKPAEIGGFLIFNEKSSTRPISSYLLTRLEKEINLGRQFSKLVQRFDRTIRSPFNMKEKVKPTSRYISINIDYEARPIDTMIDAIKQFNSNFAYIIKKVSEPRNIPKYKNNYGHLGVFNPLCFTELFSNLGQSVELMQHMGTHHTHFYRSALESYSTGKFARKTMGSVEKSITEMIEIAKNFFDQDTLQSIYDFMPIEKIEYKDNDKSNPNFTVKFIDGFFAEGKTTTTHDHVVEFDTFIRGKISFLDDSLGDGRSLLTLDLSHYFDDQESHILKALFNDFINNTGYIMQAYRLYHLLRCRRLNEIKIDRSPLSRLYFRHITRGTCDMTISEIQQHYFYPLCLYFDAIQSLFIEPINVRYETDFIVNTMIDIAPDSNLKNLPSKSWRAQSCRAYERAAFPTLLSEKLARMNAYTLIMFQYTSCVNFVTNGIIGYQMKEDVKNSVITQLPRYKELVAKHISNMCADIVTIADFVHAEHFAGWMNAIYNRSYVTLEDKKEPETVSDKELEEAIREAAEDLSLLKKVKKMVKDYFV